MKAEIIPVFCNDNNMANYAYLIHLEKSDTTIIIDAAEARPIIEKLDQLHLTPTHILTTHHHFDHVGGNLELKHKYNLKIIAPEKEFSAVPAADINAKANEELIINNLKFEIIATPGHTKGHIVYYMPEEKALFTGDTLFNLCIGGLFEGSPTEMRSSLEKIKALPNDTLIFPGHEYTRAAITKNLLLKPELEPYLQKMYLREQGKLAPTTLAEEKQFNSYLSSDEPIEL